jgi:hypothetical protein
MRGETGGESDRANGENEAKEASKIESRKREGRERRSERGLGRGRKRKGGGGLGILGSSFLRMMKWPSCYP